MKAGLAAVLMLLGAAMGGCIGGTDDASGGVTPGASDEPTDPTASAADADPESDDESALENSTVPAAPVERTLYFTTDGGVADVAPAAGSIPLPTPWTGVVLGDMKVLEFLSEPLARALVIEPQPLTVTMWVETDAIAPTTNVFDYVFWAGSTRGINLFGFVAEPTPLVAGEPHKVEFTIDFPSDVPLVVPAGDSVRFLVATGFMGDGALARLLVGGDTASSVTLTTRELAEDPVAAAGPTQEETQSGEVHGGGVVTCSDVPTAVSEAHPFSVPGDATFVEFKLAPGAGALPGSDFDFGVHEGGTYLRGTGSPYAEEGALFAGPAFEGLAGKTLELFVYTCNRGGGYELTMIHDGSAATDAET